MIMMDSRYSILYHTKYWTKSSYNTNCITCFNHIYIYDNLLDLFKKMLASTKTIMSLLIMSFCFTTIAFAGYTNWYFKRNGTFVGWYYKTTPNEYRYDNYSYKQSQDVFNESYYKRNSQTSPSYRNTQWTSINTRQTNMRSMRWI